MFPIRDSERSRSTPWITRLLVVFSAAVYLYEWMLPEEQLEQLVQTCALVPARLSQGEALDLWPFLTSMFLHASLLHAVANLWALWIFGDNVEDSLGPLRFLVFYVASGVAAGALHVFVLPHSELPTLGASGAIAGVMGAYFVLFPRARVVAVIPILCFPLIIEIPAFVYLGVWFLIQLVSGAGSLGPGSSGATIAWWAHIGGFLAGVLLLAVLGLRRPRVREE
jgi:membrane associated rhomboid family serine protease